MADNSVWMMVATMLATLDIRGTGGNERDRVDKHPTKTTPEFTNGGTWFVFSCYTPALFFHQSGWPIVVELVSVSAF